MSGVKGFYSLRGCVGFGSECLEQLHLEVVGKLFYFRKRVVAQLFGVFHQKSPLSYFVQIGGYASRHVFVATDEQVFAVGKYALLSCHAGNIVEGVCGMVQGVGVHES